MRSIMQETAALKEKQKIQLTERRMNGDRLVEKWSKVPSVGEGLIEAYDANPDKIRGLSFMLENQENYLKSLTETQISSTFSTTPQNVVRIIRLGYPNSVRGDIFLEWQMESARDAMYYVYPTYETNARGATAGNTMFESSAYRFASEIEEESVGTGTGATTNFTGTLLNTPLRPFTVKLMVDQSIIATDTGSGYFTSDGALTDSISVVNYDDGTYNITFATAPTSGAAIVMAYNYNSEVTANYTDLGNVNLALKAYQFQLQPFPIGISFSKMTELLLGSTLGIDAEETLIKAGGEELKKSLDFSSVRLAYRTALGNSAVTFDANFASAGADSANQHAQFLTNAIERAGNNIFKVLNRGGVTKIVGGPDAIAYLKLHTRFKGEGAQPKIGIHRVGSLDGVDVFKAPTAIVPNNELLCIYRNEQVQEDASIAFGTMIPLYQTQTLEFKNFYKETGLAWFGDIKTIQKKYLVRLVITNCPTN